MVNGRRSFKQMMDGWLLGYSNQGIVETTSGWWMDEDASGGWWMDGWILEFCIQGIVETTSGWWMDEDGKSGRWMDEIEASNPNAELISTFAAELCWCCLFWFCALRVRRNSATTPDTNSLKILRSTSSATSLISSLISAQPCRSLVRMSLSRMPWTVS